MTTQYSNIPQEMRELNRWLVFKVIEEQAANGETKRSKKPVNANDTRYGAKANDPQTWSSFDTAVSRVGQMSTAHGSTGEILGIGFALGDGWCGVDLDGGAGHQTSGFSEEVFTDIRDTLKTYAEISMSGNGYHFVGRYNGPKLKGCKSPDNSVEMYSENRFFVMTGNVYGDCRSVADITDAFQTIHRKYVFRGQKETNKAIVTTVVPSVPRETRTLLPGTASDKVLDCVAKDQRLYDLWQGNVLDEYPSPSEYDAALMCKLVYWLGGNEEECIKAFLASPYAQKRPNQKKLLRADYLTTTFSSAYQVSDKKETKKKSALSIEAVRNAIESLDCSIRYDEITGENEVQGKTASGRMMSYDDLLALLVDRLAESYIGCTLSTIDMFLSFIARENRYNPVFVFLSDLEWDGQDHLQGFYDLIGVDDDLSQILIHKWLRQCVALLYNNDEDPFGAEGVLVLNGPQGIGKTSLLGILAMNPKWFGEGEVINERDKDTTRRIVTKWITELGEVERSLKTNYEGTRAFITAKKDEYRLPYGRGDIVAPRHTSMAATCNSQRYLTDPEGNRRWWTITIPRKIEHSAMERFEVKQLWAQIFAEVSKLDDHERRQCFRLTDEEFEGLRTRNTDYQVKLPGEEEIQDLLDIAEANPGKYQVKTYTASQLIGQHQSLLGRYTARQIGTVLTKMGIETNSKGYRLPNIPFMPF